MKKRLAIATLCLILVVLVAGDAAAATPDAATLRSWVQKMKTRSRGPFQHIRWFCNDGTIQLPKEYACREHDGGVQHGEWTDRVKTLRANGYFIANVFADVRAPELLQDPRHPDIVKQMVLEQFLIEADDGWIFRRARYYRGALQTEDETYAGRELLQALVSDPAWRENRFMVLREAVRFIPHGRQGKGNFRDIRSQNQFALLCQSLTQSGHRKHQHAPDYGSAQHVERVRQIDRSRIQNSREVHKDEACDRDQRSDESP